MAEDGMLVNFSLSDEILRSKPVFKGGRWRDRLSAKRSTRPRPPKPTSIETKGSPITPQASAKEVAEKLDTAHAQPRKRQKLESWPNHKNTSRVAPKEVISSLFTYNPTTKASVKEAQNEEQPAEPSNAPLLDGIETFTSLGLSNALSTHLMTKFSLKTPTAIQASTINQLLTEDADAFIQAETGSGKTLAYLLPIVQRIMALSKRQRDDKFKLDSEGNSSSQDQKLGRKAGLFVVILAPTRELASQISHVLHLLLTHTPYIVAGTVIGGEKKKSEKARLRKGLNILVATPGRLADHLDNTEVLDVSQVRWLVLDEGDRLMDLGFEEEIKGVVERLEKMKRFEEEEGEKGKEGKTKGLPNKRVTVLCSATMKMTVQRLGEISLKDAVHIKAEQKALSLSSGNSNREPNTEACNEEKAFKAPAQLKQSYIVVPPKQRLVTLVALLKHTFARRGSVMKAIVFLDCADSVDFHFEILARQIGNVSIEATSKPKLPAAARTISSAPSIASKANPSLNIYRLHGSLPQPIRTSTLKSFTHSTDPAVLLCTDVASRGLDLPNIDLIIEYDPSFSADDHLHRVGRTARAGKAGRTKCFLMPGSEEKYAEVLQGGVAGGRIYRLEAEEILRKGFAVARAARTSGSEKSATGDSVEGPKTWEEAATVYQSDVERWIAEDNRAAEMARKAYVSHVRAYATHIAKEKDIFNLKSIHLGHLAKAFALRERPGNMGRGSVSEKGRTRTPIRHHQPGEERKTSESLVLKAADADLKSGTPSWRISDVDVDTVDAKAASKRMRAKIQEHMAVASEFNIG